MQVKCLTQGHKERRDRAGSRTRDLCFVDCFTNYSKANVLYANITIAPLWLSLVNLRIELVQIIN